MKKRAHERISVNVQVSLFCENEEYTGTIKNLSNNGMLIETEICPSLKSILRTIISAKLNIAIPSKTGILEVPVKVRRLVKTNEYDMGIGVELSNPQENYLAFVDGLRKLKINSYSYLSTT